MSAETEVLLENDIKDYQANNRQRLCGLVFGLMFSSVPITIGAIYKNDCSEEPMIPIWCIVHGAILMISCVLQLSFLCLGGGPGLFVRLIHLFQPIWFIVGCVYSYRNYQHLGTLVCNKTLYLFTFWYLTSGFIVSAVVILVAVFFLCCTLCFGAQLNKYNKI